METYFDLPLDYETMSSTPFLFDDSESQDNDLFEEINQGSHRRYHCTFPGCGKVFKFKSEITRHVIIHQNDRPYCCTYGGCKKSFKRADALENHIQTHAKTMPYSCDIPGCDRKFATKAAIRYHKIKHDNNRVFKCSFPGCKRSFLTSSQLKQHEKSFNVHFRYPPLKVKEEEPLKFTKGEPQYLFQEFSNLMPRPATNLQWEIRSQENEENNKVESIAPNPQENFDMIFTYFAKKSKVEQEQQVQERPQCQQWVNLLETKPQAELQLRYSIESQQTADSCKFFDNSEIKLLEFLKSRESGSV